MSLAFFTLPRFSCTFIDGATNSAFAYCSLKTFAVFFNLLLILTFLVSVFVPSAITLTPEAELLNSPRNFSLKLLINSSSVVTPTKYGIPKALASALFKVSLFFALICAVKSSIYGDTSSND